MFQINCQSHHQTQAHPKCTFDFCPPILAKLKTEHLRRATLPPDCKHRGCGDCKLLQFKISQIPNCKLISPTQLCVCGFGAVCRFFPDETVPCTTIACSPVVSSFGCGCGFQFCGRTQPPNFLTHTHTLPFREDYPSRTDLCSCNRKQLPPLPELAKVGGQADSKTITEGNPNKLATGSKR